MTLTIKRPLAATALFLGLATTAAIAADTGFYAGTNLGFNFLQDQDSDSTGRNLDLDFDEGTFLSGQIGYKFAGTETGRFRTELEISYRNNDVDDIVFNGNQQVGGGDEEVLAGLVNVFYDFTGVSEKFVPFVGVGAGIAELDAGVSYNNGNAFVRDQETDFAYQAIVGAEYKINDRVSFTGDARYFSLLDPELTRFGGPAPAAFTNQDSEYDTFSISVGLRYNF